MSVRRHALSNEQFKRIEPLLPGKPSDSGANSIDNRLFIEAVLYIIQTGAPWRDLPERYGPWQRTYQRFNRFSKSGRWARIVAELWDYEFFDELQIDSTIVRVHQHAAGQKKATAKPKRSAARAVD